MKKLHYWRIMLCAVIHLFLFSSCEKEDPMPIDLESICKEYKGDELRIFLNGEEYSSSEEAVKLALSSPMLQNTDGTDASGNKMQLTLLPLWPNLRVYPYINNFELLLIEVEAISSPDEVLLKGIYTDAPQYTLEVEGSYREGVLTLNLTYMTNIPNITGHAFIFDFSIQSIDLTYLNPKIRTVEYDGQQIPIEEFVRDTMSPILKLIGERLGGSLRIEFFPDGSTDVSIVDRETGRSTPVVGKHGYRFHDSSWGYLFADTEGVTWMSDRVEAWHYVDLTPLYGWRARDKYFVSVFYDYRQSKMLFTIEAPAMSQFRNFLSPWLDSFGNGQGISKEETAKGHMITNMIYNKEIQLICMGGSKEN